MHWIPLNYGCLCAYFSDTIGRYSINEDTTVIIGKHHLHRAWHDYSLSTIEWTFMTTNYSKIIFHFTEFDCYTHSVSACHAEIGDGLEVGQSRRILVHGRTVPSDVISFSTTAWLQVGNNIRTFRRLRIEISAKPGMFNVTFNANLVLGKGKGSTIFLCAKRKFAMT